jgi:lantibiotic modifying enzyme
LRRRYRRDDLLRLATRLGEASCSRLARRSDGGWSWNTLEGQTERDLTGYSHGAAGIACALLELSVETGSAAFREAAERGVRLRAATGSAANRRTGRTSAREPTACLEMRSLPSAGVNGAPGIGLSRLRGVRILKDDDSQERSGGRCPNHQSHAHPIPAYTFARVDFTLCHGRGGNAELLIYAPQALGDGTARETAEAVGRQGIELFARNNLPWPCGVPGGGETPNLMLALRELAISTLGSTIPSTCARS